MDFNYLEREGAPDIPDGEQCGLCARYHGMLADLNVGICEVRAEGMGAMAAPNLAELCERASCAAVLADREMCAHFEASL